MSINGNVIALAGGVDTSDATAYASDILQGKTAYARDEKITGTMPAGTGLRIAITTDAGATITAVNGSTTLTSSAPNGSTTVVIPNGGNWNFQASKNGLTSATHTKNYEDSLSLPMVSTNFNSNSWAVIRNVSDSGNGANFWNIGATKSVTLKTAFSGVTSITLGIIGFNHNATREGDKRIHLMVYSISGSSNKCVFNGYKMNNSDTNSGGWNSSVMRTSTCATFKNALPNDLINVLKTVTKYTDNKGGGSDTASNVSATTDTIFIPAEFEVFGTRTYANSNEKNYQAKYSIFSDNASRIRYNHSSSSSAVTWWLRSPYASSSGSFCRVSTGGTASFNGASYANGFAPCLCV